MEYFIKTNSGVPLFVNDINPEGHHAILFIHGWPANYKAFEYQYNELGKLGYRLIGVDTRGFGNSGKPWSGYDYNTLADDLRCIIDSLGLHNITLLGHSTGGAIAIRYMSRHNGCGIGKLVLAASAAPSLVKRPDFPYGLDVSVVTDIIKNAYEDRPKMLTDFGKIFFYSKISQPFSEFFFNLGLEAASWSTIAIAQTWLAEVLFNDMKAVHVPTLIMHGIHDQVVPYELGIIQNRGIAGSRMATFEQSGHGLFYDEKDKFNKVLSEFAR